MSEGGEVVTTAIRWLFITIIILALAFCGEPDIHDAIREQIVNIDVDISVEEDTDGEPIDEAVESEHY